MSKKMKDLMYILTCVLTFLIFIAVYIGVEKIPLLSEIDNSANQESETSESNESVITTVWIENIEKLYEKYEIQFERSSLSEELRTIFLDYYYVLRDKEEINQEYFNNNKQTILDFYKVNNYTSFKHLYDYLRNYEDNIERLVIIEDSIIQESDGIYFSINVVFSSKNEKRFKIFMVDIDKYNCDILISPENI